MMMLTPQSQSGAIGISRDQFQIDVAVAMHSAFIQARREALETTGQIPVYRAGTVVWETVTEEAIDSLETRLRLLKKGWDALGRTHLTAVVRNPAEPDRTWEGIFLVDITVVDSFVPGTHLEEINLRPERQRVFEQVDGSTARLDVAAAGIELMHKTVGATIVFEETEGEVRLGTAVLASIGLDLGRVDNLLQQHPSGYQMHI